MNQQTPGLATPEVAADHAPDARQLRILDAAQRCFARGGFHRVTMADVAQEAGMSAGNIYRYFSSKDQVVARLCELDRADLAAGFDALLLADDPIEAFRLLGRRHLVDEPRHRAMLVAEIWAEAVRNPVVSQISQAFDRDMRARLGGFMLGLKARGLMPAATDHETLIDLIQALVDGVIVRRARDAAFDPAPYVDHIANLIFTAASGALTSRPAPPDQTDKS